MIFPVLCPVCQADSGRRVIPDSPEVETFRCGACQHSWSEPAPNWQPMVPAQRANPLQAAVRALRAALERVAGRAGHNPLRP